MLLMLWTLLMTPLVQASQGPYMWGVGPTISTIVLPGTHPFNFPDEADAAGFKGTGGDVGFGLHGVMYMRATQRFGTHMWYHTGQNGYSSPNLTLEYDFVGSSANGVTVLGGLGGGFGSQSWENEAGSKLKMNTFILRAQGSVNYRTKANCFEIGAFVNMLVLSCTQPWASSLRPSLVTSSRPRRARTSVNAVVRRVVVAECGPC